MGVDELAGLGAGIDEDAIAFAAGVLHHDDGVGTGGQGRAGHDLDGLAAADFAGEAGAGADFADHLERARQVGGMHREAVADGARHGRVVAVSGDIFGKHASPRRLPGRRCRARGVCRRARTVSITQRRASANSSDGTFSF